MAFQVYASIDGLEDYQISYVVQAAETERRRGVKIMFERVWCYAHILHKKNLDCTDSKLYVGFDEQNEHKVQSQFMMPPLKDGVGIRVQFQLKRSYFNNLRKAVDNLPSEVILRITPSKYPSLSSSATLPDLETGKYGELDDKQKVALKLILADVRYNSPPLLLSGPFGTGKTRILAIASHMLFQKYPAHILVCTQQRESAKNFLFTYRRVKRSFSGHSDESVKIMLLSSYGKPPPSLKDFYKTPDDLQNCIISDEQRLLIITTCLTAHHVTRMDVNFTHIFIDEGAQMREPEAVAALTMAKANTRIVIAGDPQQVGPAMLVFGEDAKAGGLNKSLLERLMKEYQKLQTGFVQRNHVTLVTNYRCHKDIRNLSGSLFYPDVPLKAPHLRKNQTPLVAFGEYGKNSSLYFVCSEIGEIDIDSNVNNVEATASVDVLKDIEHSWPKHIGDFTSYQVCIMSTNRSQLKTIYKGFDKKQVSDDLKRVRLIPTFSMQGNEYRVLILSTSEPIKEDGTPTIDPSKSLCNPHVFNTAITRAKNLVVAVGNPTNLLKTESVMVDDSKYAQSGHCWSNFIKHCIENDAISFSRSLNDSKEANLRKVTELVQCQLGGPISLLKDRPRVAILEENYKVGHKLGSGGYGVVLQVTRLTDRRQLAIKLKICTSNEERTQAEAKVLADLKHDNIVQYYDSGLAKSPEWEDWSTWREAKRRRLQHSSTSSASTTSCGNESTCFYILTELCEGKTLRDWLDCECEHRNREDICNYMHQILCALKYIHDKSLAHRDLKPSNIFFKGGKLKVGDFGFVKDIEEQSALEMAASIPSDGSQSQSSKVYGTKYYRSPELHDKQKRKDWQKVDVYALGVIFFELCWIIKRFRGNEEDKIMRRLLPMTAKQDRNFPKDFEIKLGDSVSSLILDMTAYEPGDRPTICDILGAKGKFQAYFRSVRKRKKSKTK